MRYSAPLARAIHIPALRTQPVAQPYALWSLPPPPLAAFGMVCALSVGFIWQGLASYWELNVSATHSIIGAIMGFSLVYGGGDAVLWAAPDTTSFPPYKGVVPVGAGCGVRGGGQSACCSHRILHPRWV